MKTTGSQRPADVLSASEMRNLEAQAIAIGSATGLELMERAGEGVVAAIAAYAPQAMITPGKALILCGPGNNGGDGYVIARLLRQRGWQIALLALGDAGALPPDARTNRGRWDSLGAVRSLLDPLAATDLQCDLCIDAVFGIGLARAVDGPLALCFQQINAALDKADCLRVAVDLPSGVETDSGAVLGAALSADLTVTFHCRKPAHLSAPELCGEVRVAGIGL